MLRVNDFYTLSGRMGRLRFLSGIFIIIILSITLHYASFYIASYFGSSKLAMVLIVVLQFVMLLLATPLIVKRLHDLNASGWFALVFWVPFPFSIEMSALLDSQWLFGLLFELYQFLLWLTFAIVMGFIFLLIVPGNPELNQWGSPNQALQRTSR
ncbi:MAG: DUF805 domain-containing protein [Candidatus Thiodiazotropha lotti]|nr:DUF805 domain-containing protein [Candidatus Thiodiazotropha lotti]MCG7998220.1 DUF805 domain-containing protein [Candidatus Thiodiazotropha lotti]MCW4182849.1 DUF805 domain-containing protein [Candidatus Thiodiazotropha weberae]MCW4189986.1 DUF805 domain-containing protein [Candidatus Thiodiazotropha weberae]